MAARKTLPVTFEKSGLKRNSMPAAPPGSRHEQTTTTSNSRKSVGISAFEAFSIPPRTPRTMMTWVSRNTTTVQNTGRRGDAEKSAK